MSTRRVSRAFSLLTIVYCLIFVLSGPKSANIAQAATTNLGVQDYEVSGVEVVLLSVKRTSDGFVTLKWAYQNTTNSPKTIGANTGAMEGAWGAPYSLAWDVSVGAAGATYKVPPGTHGGLMAGSHAGPAKTVVVGAKQTYATWAKIAGVPKDVTKVTVYIQGTDPFEEIPIS